ncbi:MAG: hypothetical protein MJZ09_07610 [Bacteroidales bacterium]|nr:hypothetical protein [Bacteroidales bacterium]
MKLKNIEKEHINDNDYGYFPSIESYEAFGANKKKIEKKYEEVCEDLRKSPIDNFKETKFITVIYDGGISLTADKPMLGHEQGENLMDLFKEEWVDRSLFESSLFRSILGLPIDYHYMTCTDFVLTTKKEYHRMSRDLVKFNLKIPVKIVMYLTWLNDMLTDPNAPLPIVNDTLHCQFTENFPIKDQ